MTTRCPTWPRASSGASARSRRRPIDINTACTSFLYGLSTATALIRTGVVRNALVIGAELISPFMDWSDRDVAVLFGDGAAAVVLEESDRGAGRAGARNWAATARRARSCACRAWAGSYANRGVLYGVTRWQFEGQEIFKRAVQGMSGACDDALTRLNLKPEDVDLVVPHQANLRIIEAVAKRTHVPMEKVYVTIQRYGNMSSATVPVALCDALEERARAARGAADDARIWRRPELLRAPGALGQPHHASAGEQRGVAAERSAGAADRPRVPGRKTRLAPQGATPAW